jgi:hypothetical protein
MAFVSPPDKPAPRRPPCLVSFLTLHPECGWLPDGQIAFLHQRTAYGGKTRLVKVEVECNGGWAVPRAPSSPGQDPQDAVEQSVPDLKYAEDGTPVGWPYPWGANLSIHWKVIVPGSLETSPYNIAHGEAGIVLSRGTRSTIYGGQPDPNDPSHFTIRYEVDEGSGTIDGWLQADDQVRFKIRDGPATHYEQSPESLLE